MHDDGSTVQPVYHNDAGGSSGPVIQLGSITGSLHVHTTGGVPAAVPRQLPAAPVRFINRRVELAELTDPAALGLAVVTGSGGMGKTSLALRWAYQQLNRFPDGQLYVDMRGFAPYEQPVSAARALRGFLGALGVSEDSQPSDVESQASTFRSLVAGKRLLVLVDNVRHCGDVVRLLPGSPTCTVVVTSRFHLAELIAKGARIVDLDVLTDDQVVALLTERVGRPRLDAEPAAVSELVRYCAGLPLAVSILAARIVTQPAQSLAELADELREDADRLDGFDTGDLSLSLRAVLACSTQSLDPAAARVFRLLGAAPCADIGLDSVLVLTGHPKSRARSLLRTLEAAHLVRQHAPGRYRMHDLVRLYAGGLTPIDDPDTTAAVRGLVDFLLYNAHRAARLLAPYRPEMEIPLTGVAPGQDLVTMPTARAAIDWLTAEHQCLLDTQPFALRRGWPEVTWQLAWSLVGFHHRQGHPDGHASWQVALEAATLIGSDVVLSLTHRHLGYLHLHDRDHAAAVEHLTLSAALAERAGSVPNQVATLRAMAGAHDQAGDVAAAMSTAQRALELCRTVDLPVWEAELLGQTGEYHAKAGDHAAAATRFEAALTIHGDHGDVEGIAYCLHRLGTVAAAQGDHGAAITLYQRSLDLLAQFGNKAEELVVLDSLADSHTALGDRDEANRAWQRALGLSVAQRRPDQAERIRSKMAGPTG
ncbi:ATP-binding protein [Actinokineospora globicatena]|uniref:ATPase n=1 Tax=Actinokineospora globicatena TaxID=103729 RepID=A0A9W6V5M4_9PSEU|nr:tetratricopeptide repeat protein [Actinokineospora globicatena]GLW90530.1 ATPase [Actinokineospora globicatena]